MEESKTKIFPIITKTDNFGSGEVIEKLLLEKNADNLTIDIIHKGIGNIISWISDKKTRPVKYTCYFAILHENIEWVKVTVTHGETIRFRWAILY